MSERVAAAGLRLPRPLDLSLSRKAVELTAMFVAAMFFAYVYMAVKFTLAGDEGYHFGDFFALWTSAVITHGGDAAVNFDPDALHARQIALGMNPDGYNPFPYPPTFLLLLGPLGRLAAAPRLLRVHGPRLRGLCAGDGVGAVARMVVAAVAPASRRRPASR